MTPPCRRCGAERRPCEAVAFGDFCEDCWAGRPGWIGVFPAGDPPAAAKGFMSGRPAGETRGGLPAEAKRIVAQF